MNLLDINVHVEDFYRDLLNLVYGWQLKNMNQWNQNAAGFTKNAYDGALNWSELLTDLVGEAYGREIQEMYQQYVHQRFGVEVKSHEEMKKQMVSDIIAREWYLNIVSRYIEQKGCREAIDYYIETHTPFFYQKGTGQYGVKGDNDTILTDKDFTVHQRFLMGKWQYVFTTNYDNALDPSSRYTALWSQQNRLLRCRLCLMVITQDATSFLKKILTPTFNGTRLSRICCGWLCYLGVICAWILW